jgi:hypothetical protein
LDMLKARKKEHPANLFNKARHHLFSMYEKTRDFDKALSVLNEYPLIRPSKYGLKAELLFYDKFYRQLKLEPLLDAGIKADFSGLRKKRAVNFDVTTNLQYKDINKYANIVQKKKKRYEIALVNLKSEEVEFFPLRFPICPECGLFSHYVLFMSRPSSDVFWSSSRSQAIIRYCPQCNEFDILKEYSYEMSSILVTLKDVTSIKMDPEVGDPNFDLDKFITSETIPVVQSFESESQKMLSALAEGDYIITDPRDASGYFGGTILWTHPLANNYFGETIDYDYYDGTYVIE